MKVIKKKSSERNTVIDIYICNVKCQYETYI